MSKMLKKVSVALSLVVSAGAMAQEQAGMYYTQPSTVPIDEYLEQISNAEEVEEGLRRGRIFAFWNDCKPLARMLHEWMNLAVNPSFSGSFRA